MSTKQVLLFPGILFAFFTCGGVAGAQTFTAEKISDHAYLVQNPDGEDQLVVASARGLVVFNTFWSSITAQEYKDEISRLLDRDDFYVTVNMVDRLDTFGGNAAYKETTIIGHQTFWTKYKGQEKEIDAEIKRLIDMWRWKEGASAERLKTLTPGSDEEKRERDWANECKRRADQIESGFSLVLPTVVYEDRKTVDLGNMTLELLWFGRAGSDGMTVAYLPEEKLAVIPGFIMHSQHLTAYPHSTYTKLDVARWIDVLEEVLEGNNPVEQVICDMTKVWPRERARTHLVYLRTLWGSVKKAEAAGKSMVEVQEQLSLDNEFAFVKETQVYEENSDEWIRPQHRAHVRVFYLQHKNLASEILKKEMDESVEKAVAHVKKLRKNGSDVYFDEFSINGLGYELMNSDRMEAAIEVFKLNTEIFPESANAYDSLAEAFMKHGEHTKAIDFYRKSLELNPDNENAKETLKKLEVKHTG